jgi:aminoglycoside phosphotransferase (APT) family kinase protein
VLAAIHSVDVAAAGLKDFGKLEDYCARQVRALGV